MPPGDRIKARIIRRKRRGARFNDPSSHLRSCVPNRPRGRDTRADLPNPTIRCIHAIIFLLLLLQFIVYCLFSRIERTETDRRG